MGKRPRILNDVLDKDLNDYQIVKGYYLEREHGLAGFFPAIITATKEMVTCSDKDIIEAIRAMLPVKRNKIVEVFLLLNKKGEFGFVLNSINGEERHSASVLSREEYEKIIKTEKEPFRWAPGLVAD